ncbi:MAG: hypothetical protein G3M78_05780 [Candidatus Nitrohelix vancouverensis]|uniref:AsmA family protein n=1 Tax=Candidatus Nitrohelix vancouverensis TaxID=2705534 RepID=A0A7T0G314_9BACT|nr:MAG: hypothetical protein G3M78_05780 [Candidatus Nitrohelix vancouverensis]
MVEINLIKKKVQPEKTPPKGEPDSSPKTPKKKKSALGLLSQFLFRLVLLFFGIVLLSGLVLQYYFPSEFVTPLVQQEMSRTLKTHVRIKSIQLNLLDGARISGLEIGSPQPLIKFKELILGYDLLELLSGNILINQAVIEDPTLYLEQKNGRWNFQPFLDLAGPPQAKPETPAPSAPPGLPPIPMTVDLRRAAIQNIRVDVNIEPGIRAGLTGLTLETKLQANKGGIQADFRALMSAMFADSEFNVYFLSSVEPKISLKTQLAMNMNFSAADLNGGRLTGALGLNNTHLELDKKLTPPRIGAQMDLHAFLNPQVVSLNRLVLKLGEHNQFDLKAKVIDYMQDPDFQLQFNNGNINIEEILSWVKDLLPPMNAKGEINVKAFEIKGRAPQMKPGDISISPITVQARNIQAEHSPTSARVNGVHADIALPAMKLVNGALPERVAADLKLFVAEGGMQNLSLKKLEHQMQVSASGPDFSKAALDFDLKLGQAQFQHPETGAIQTALTTKGSVRANLKTGAVESLNVSYEVDDWLNGKTSATASNFGKDAFAVEQALNVDLQTILKRIPPQLAEQLKGIELSGDIVVNASAKGSLTETFQPKQIDLQTRVDLKQISANLQQPVSARIESLSGSLVAPILWDPEQGVKLNSLTLDAQFAQAQAMDIYSADKGRLQVAMSMDAFLNPKQADIATPVALNLAFDLEQAQGSEPAMKIQGLVLGAKLKGDLYPADFKNVSLEATFGMQGSEALEKISTGPFVSRFRADVHDLGLERSELSLKANLQNPSLLLDGETIETAVVGFELRSRHNLKRGDIEIDLIRADIPNLLKLKATGRLGEWGKTFEIDSALDPVQLKTALDMIPASLLDDALRPQGLTGAAFATLKAKGSLPKSIELENFNLPFAVDATAGLKNVSAILPTQGLEANALNISSRLTAEGDQITASGRAAIAQLLLPEHLGEATLDPEFEFSYQIDRLNAFKIKRHQFSLKQLGMTHRLAGQAEGFNPLVTGEKKADLATLIQLLTLAFSTQNQIQIDQALAGGNAITAGKNLSAEGALKSTLDLKMTRGKSIDLSGSAQFDHFKAAMKPDLEAGEINGTFVFEKNLLLDRSLLAKKQGSKFLASEQGFFSQLRDFSNYKNIIRVDSIKFQNKEISDFGIDLFFKDNRLVAEKFLFNLLDGAVGGNFYLGESKEGPVIRFFTEFTGLDAGALLPNRAGLRGRDAQVDGRLTLDIPLKKMQNASGVGIDQISAVIEISHIGSEMMDRLLLSVDPEESKPAVVDTRAKLKLASPHRARIQLKNGKLDVEAWLKNKLLGGVIKAPELKRIPVSSLAEFKQVSEGLKQLENLQTLFAYLAAQGIEIDEDGNISFY